eukprot:1161613-Pelagomonas_calceolata.AAC.3
MQHALLHRVRAHLSEWRHQQRRARSRNATDIDDAVPLATHSTPADACAPAAAAADVSASAGDAASCAAAVVAHTKSGASPVPHATCVVVIHICTLHEGEMEHLGPAGPGALAAATAAAAAAVTAMCAPAQALLAGQS